MGKRKIKVVILGAGGATGSLAAKYLTEKGVDVVGVDIRNIGTDIGDILNIGPIGVKLRENFQQVVCEEKPDVIIDCTFNDIPRVYPNVKFGIEHDANYLLLGENCGNAFYSEPEMAEELDRIAKEHNVSILATGIVDVFFHNLSTSLSGACHKIDEMKVQFYAILDDFGKEVAKEIGVGMTEEEYRSHFTEDKLPPYNSISLTLMNIALELKLHILEAKTIWEPRFAKEDVYCKQMDWTIPKGNVIGTDVGGEVTTEEGVTIVGIMHEKIGEPNQDVTFSWEISGEPNVKLIVPYAPDESVSLAVVNRTPDIINAKAGLLRHQDMSKLLYKPLSFENYVDLD